MVPTLALLTTLVMTLTDTRRTIALPVEGGPDAALVEAALAGERLRAIFVEDPSLALARGEADGAVRWEQGGAAPLRVWDGRADARLIAVIETRDEETQEHLSDALVEIGDALLEAEVVLAGGDPLAVAVADIDELEAEGGSKDGLRKIAPTGPDGYWVLGFTFLGVYGLMFSLPVAGLQDRKQGIAEALAVLPVPAFTLHTARLVAWCAIAALSAGLLMAEVTIFIGSSAPLPSPGAVLAGVGGLFFAAAAMHTIGVACRSPVTAMNLGPGAGLAVLAAMVGGTHLGSPGWVPVLGLVSPDGSGARALAGVIALGLSGLLIALGARLERARIEEGA